MRAPARNCGPNLEHEDMLVQDVPLVEFMYLVFTHTPGESHCRGLKSWLFTCVKYFEC